MEPLDMFHITHLHTVLNQHRIMAARAEHNVLSVSTSVIWYLRVFLSQISVRRSGARLSYPRVEYDGEILRFVSVVRIVA
jgi:hypothetical protein